MCTNVLDVVIYNRFKLNMGTSSQIYLDMFSSEDMLKKSFSFFNNNKNKKIKRDKTKSGKN